MEKKNETNALLKIISFIIAIVIWAYIAIVIDPMINVTVREIAVEYFGEEKLTKAGLSVIGQKDNKVEIKVKGSRKIVSDLNSKNITANLNLAQATESGKYKIPINVTLPIDNALVVKKKPYYIDVNIDKVVEKRFNIKLNTVGNIKNGFVCYDTKITPSSVLVSGSEKIVNQVSEAVVTIDYNDTEVDINETFKIALFDKDGAEIRSSLIIKDTNGANVFLKISELKTINIMPKFLKPTGASLVVNSENYKVIPDMLTIYGKLDVVKKIDKIYTEPFVLQKDGEIIEKKLKLQIPDEINVREDIKEVTVQYIKNKPK